MADQPLQPLQELLYGVPLRSRQGPVDVQVRQLQVDSRRVGPGDLYAAIPGTQVDGHAFIEQAVTAGASTIICEELPEQLHEGVAYLQVKHARRAIALLAANYYDHPSQAMQVVGVTGTNGKTTVATLLYRLFSALGYRCGLLSTVRIYIGDESYDTRHTTPDPILLQRWLARMREQQCQYCFMEVSSHAAHQRRIDGMVFQGGIFTNITQDHLDYHPTFQDYLLAKKRFFDLLPADAFALSNRDDRNGRVMVQDTAAQPYYYALRTQADFHIRIQEKSLEGLLLRFNDTAAYCRLTGVFNAYNLGAVYGAARLLGIEKQQLLTTLSSLAPIEGRFEVIRVPAGPIGIVDYAHTPDALKNVLRTIWDVSQASRQLITVIGCGGERDKDKRPQMAKTALDYSDRLILTSDNPRHEDPEAILADMERGVPVAKQRKVLKISDRREAIKAATQLAQPGDVVLIAGKGHEPYQEIKGVRFDFSDRQEFLQAIQPTQS